MKKIYSLFIACVLLLSLLPAAAMADGFSGEIDSITLLPGSVSLELKDLTPISTESKIEVQLWSGTSMLTSVTLNPEKLSELNGRNTLTCCIPLAASDEYWPQSDWTPKADTVPTKAVLIYNDQQVSEKEAALDATVWAAMMPYSGSIESVVMTRAGGVLKNAISVELEDVTFRNSVKVALFSDDILLTTATLSGVEAGSYEFLTCCIATEEADPYWAQTSWTPRDSIIPNKVVLIVDGIELDTHKFTLNAEEWANLPGTAAPATGSIERAGITHKNDMGLLDGIAVDMKDIFFMESVVLKLYAGETLLTTAALNTKMLPAAPANGFLTCTFPAEGGDEYWNIDAWAPQDDIVPNKVVLVIDDTELDTHEFTLNAEEWANLPGTEAQQPVVDPTPNPKPDTPNTGSGAATGSGIDATESTTSAPLPPVTGDQASILAFCLLAVAAILAFAVRAKKAR